MSLMSAGLKPFDPFDPEVMDDPYPYFAWMRENDPVHMVEALGMPLITRAEDVEAALRDVATFSSVGWMELRGLHKLPVSVKPVKPA